MLPDVFIITPHTHSSPQNLDANGFFDSLVRQTMYLFAISTAGIVTIALLFRENFGTKSRWIYGGIWILAVAVLLPTNRTLLPLAAVQALLAAVMLIHLKLVRGIDL